MSWISRLIFALLFVAAPPSKKAVENVIRGKTGNDIVTENWYAKNDDSCFYKSDTVRLYKSSYYTYQSKGACEFLIWHFSKGKLSLSSEIICQEPPVSIGYGDEAHHFNYKVQSKNKNLELISYK